MYGLWAFAGYVLFPMSESQNRNSNRLTTVVALALRLLRITETFHCLGDLALVPGLYSCVHVRGRRGVTKSIDEGRCE